MNELWVSCLHTCANVTKQYSDFVSAKVWWCQYIKQQWQPITMLQMIDFDEKLTLWKNVHFLTKFEKI